ncbi:hypothetical protein N0V93_003752 [Gnomoniopsis smithogilvyi]|uniref:SWIM-type domain-containing protein n=1 Tax=Gnomoniopsis smithogilvyi TaxID=1191159 RepID=A0A9W8YZT6_9PEZI|nr:hypothetical protein N0V93_003752 [Gnomoniopsis smithogilvyi]
MSFTVSTSHFSRLSLGSMGPTTRSRRQQQRIPPANSGIPRSVNVAQDPSSDDDDGADSDASMEGDEDEDEDTRTVVSSPFTMISYDISDLDPDIQSEVRQLFRETPVSEPPPLVLQWCQFNQDQQDNQFYAFQLHEVVPRSIRIGSLTSRYRHARCNCMGDSPKPCKHLIYLLDQLNRITGDKLLDEPVQKLRSDGASAQLDRPFEKIASFHLDLLASNLHCDVGSPESQANINPVRLEETRELLAAVGNSDADDYAVKHFRPDIFEDRDSLLQQHNIITDDDLTKTVAKMLMTNNDFFAYFLKLLGPTSKARDGFWSIQRHVDRVLRELDAHYLKSTSQETAIAHGAEGPRDVAWAAAHILRAVATIQYLLQNREDAPSPAERASAARTLVRILHTVVFEWNRDITASSSSINPVPGSTDNNLYLRLMDTQTTPTSTSFILDSLAHLPEQNQWIETLEEIEAKLMTYAPPPAFMLRLRNLITLMRSSRPAAGRKSSSAAGSKRSGGEGSGRQGGPKRAR